MAVAIEFDVDGVRYLSLGLDRTARRMRDTRGLMQQLGAAVESQTKRRIQEEKTAPDGTPWKPWSPGYAATRHGNHSLLVNQGHLLNSIRWALAGAELVNIGTNLEYAPYHQGGVPWHTSRELGGIPARPFLDVEFEHRDNLDELDNILGDWAADSLQKSAKG